MKKVKVVLHDECIAAGGRQEYPDGWTGSVVSRNDFERLLRVKFGKPFIGRSQDRKKFRLQEMWIPEWLTQPTV